MWNIDTLWFDVAVVGVMFAVGNILFGHFEEHRSKLRRLLKFALFLVMTVVLSSYGLRWVAYSVMGALAVFMAHIHLWWLPSRGVNGWTGEPKERYYELIGAYRDKRGKGGARRPE
jgi:predicted MFS family arabinose efflux permease